VKNTTTIQTRRKSKQKTSVSETIRTILLVGDGDHNEPLLAQLLDRKGYRVIQASTENLIEGDMPEVVPQAAIVNYNWPSNIGLRAYLLNHHQLHSLPIIFFGPDCKSGSGRDLNVIGLCPDVAQPETLLRLLTDYFKS